MNLELHTYREWEKILSKEQHILIVNNTGRQLVEMYNMEDEPMNRATAEYFFDFNTFQHLRK